jgi:hypothetical protein
VVLIDAASLLSKTDVLRELLVETVAVGVVGIDSGEATGLWSEAIASEAVARSVFSAMLRCAMSSRSWTEISWLDSRIRSTATCNCARLSCASEAD